MLLGITVPILGEVDTDLLMAEVGLFVSGLSCIIGMWVERDRERPMRYTLAVSVLILLATAVSMYQAISQAEDAAKQQADMATMLQKIDKLMQTSGVKMPGLDDLMKNTMESASRSNPAVIKKMAQRVADEGGDPSKVLGGYLPASDVQQLKRSGELKVQPKEEPKPVTALASAVPATPPPDAKAKEIQDAGIADAGASAIDAGPAYVDAGPPYVDAGPPYVDAGPPVFHRPRGADPYDEIESEAPAPAPPPKKHK